MTTHEPRIPAALARLRQQLTCDLPRYVPKQVSRDGGDWHCEMVVSTTPDPAEYVRWSDVDAALAALGEPEKEKSVAPQIDNRLNENTRQWGRIYCPSCSEVKALLIDHMDGDLNPHDALDIMCGDCRFIIATLYGPSAALGEPPAPPLWQPIETAPRDGSSLLMWNGGTLFGRWNRALGRWRDECADDYMQPPPTYWMSLPDPPFKESA